MGKRVPATLIAAYGILVTAWIVGNPPFAAPDESSHYVRAIGITGGELRGRPVRSPVPGDVTGDVRAWYEANAGDIRSVLIPAGLYGPGLTCNATRPEVSAGCLDDVEPTKQAERVVTLVATYPPAPYALPGAAARTGSDVFQALRLGRAAAAILCLAFLALAVVLLLVPGTPLLSLVGIVAATTPMVVFTASTLNPSGLEICAGIAFFASLLRLLRGGNERWPWAAATVAGVALALSRSTGPVWLVLDVGLALLLAPTAARHALSARRGAAALAGTVVATAVLVSLTWSIIYGPSAAVSLNTVISRVKVGVGVLPLRLTEEVGKFGWLDAAMPTLAVMGWHALIVAVLSVAFVLGSGRERMALAAACALALSVPIAFSAWYSGLTLISDVQGRHVLPFVVVVPLLAGEVLTRNASRLEALGAVPLLLAVPVVAGAVQLVAWTWNAHRHAVGSAGPRFFLRSPEWSPPLGWWTWITVAAIGSALLAFAGTLAARHATVSRRSFT